MMRNPASRAGYELFVGLEIARNLCGLSRSEMSRLIDITYRTYLQWETFGVPASKYNKVIFVLEQLAVMLENNNLPNKGTNKFETINNYRRVIYAR